MCCRLTVSPLDPVIAKAILVVGLFVPDANGVWRRNLPDGNRVEAELQLDQGQLRLSISPSITVYAHHQDKRVAASVYLEIAAKYAEKVDGRITQLSNVVGCSSDGVARSLELAQYPEHPLLWENCCNGFRELFMQPIGD